MTYHHASVVVWGHVPQADAIRFATLMSRWMTPAEVEEARTIYDASGQYDYTCAGFFGEGPARTKAEIEKRALRTWLFARTA